MLINHAFFSQHWQRKPLLLRQAVRLPENSPDKKLLFSLAGDENIETRLVLEHGERPWEVHYGPFSSTELDQLPGSRWTILFQDMDKHLQEVAELLAQFEGMPRWRIDDIMISYTPFGHSDWQSIVADIKKFGSTGKKTAVVSTINGDANVPFYKELGNQSISAEDIPVVAFSVGEEELSGLDTTNLVGHLAAWNYFQSADTDANAEWVAAWKERMGEDRVTNDPMEAHYIGFNMWVEAVKKAGTTDPEAVGDAIIGVAVPNLSGGLSAMMPNHHITKPVLIGEIQDDGQF